ncbi:MAG: gliding motility-associated C-terminal domain-containing protein [Bacteroidota bacterium]
MLISQTMLLIKKNLLRLTVVLPLLFFLQKGSAQPPGFYLSINMLDDSCWGVFVEPVGIDPSPLALTGSGQVTIEFPLGFDISSMTNVSGMWGQGTTVVSPMEAPNSQFVSFGLLIDNGISYAAGESTLLFIFCSDDPCPPSMDLIDCSGTMPDPFCDPNSLSSNPANDLSVIDVGVFPFGFYFLQGNGNSSVCDYPDCDGDGISDFYEDTNGNGIFDPGIDSSDLCDPCDPFFNYAASVELIGDDQTFCGTNQDSIYFAVTLTDFAGDAAPAGLGPMTVRYSIDSIFYFFDDYFIGDSLAVPLWPGNISYEIHSITFNQTCELVLDDALFELYVDGPVSFSAQPDDIFSCQPAGYYFMAMANNTSNGPLYFQWQCSEDGGMSWNDLLENIPYEGVTTDSLFLSDISGITGNYYRLAVQSDFCETIYSEAALLQYDGMPIELFDTLQICPGDSALINNVYETVAGNYNYTGVGTDGCPYSYHTALEFFILEEKFDTINICAGDSILIFGNYEKEVGNYTGLINNLIGCDTVLNINLQINELEEIFDVVNVCEGDSVLIFGSYESEEGVYVDTLAAAIGCDLISTVWLQFLPVEQITDTIEICDFDSVFIFGNYVSEPGIYNGIIESAFGCDTLLTVILEVNYFPINIVEFIDVCPGDAAYIFGNYETEPGIYFGVLPGSTGCDTVLNIVLGITDLEEKFEQQKICAGDSIFIFGNYETTPGLFVDTIKGTVGCDTVFTIELIEAPTELIFESATICEGDSVLIFGNYETEAGTYIYDTPPAFGCDTVFYFDLFVDPHIQVEENHILCFGDSVLINGQYINVPGSYSYLLEGDIGCDTMVTAHVYYGAGGWSFHDVSVCEGDSVLIFGNYESVAGTYQDVAQSVFGCDSLITVTLDVIPIDFVQETITICEGDSVLIFGNYETEAGTYSDFIDSIGCGVEQNYILKYSPEIEVNLIAENSCFDGSSGSLLADVTGGTPPYAFSWSNNQQGQDPLNDQLPAGTYFLTVTNGLGCTASAQGMVEESPDIDFELAVENASCSDMPDGRVSILDYPAGMQFSLDGQNFTGEPVFTELPAGGYMLQLLDAEGCTYEQPFDVKQPEGFDLYLPDDMTIQLGDSVQLTSQVTSFGPMQYRWEEDDDLSCSDCPAPWASPLQTRQFYLTAIDENHCEETESITIFINKNTDVYVPSAFSPNGDGINDLLLVYAGASVQEVKRFLIFDRWGEPVFDQYHFAPNYPAFGWDGQFKGQFLNPAVFVWVATVEYIDGREEVLKGEVNLIR